MFLINVNTIQDGLIRGCSRMGGGKNPPLPKICHTYPTIMKLGTVIPRPKKIQKKYESRGTPLEHISPEFSKLCYIKKCRYRLYFDT